MNTITALVFLLIAIQIVAHFRFVYGQRGFSVLLFLDFFVFFLMPYAAWFIGAAIAADVQGIDYSTAFGPKSNQLQLSLIIALVWWCLLSVYHAWRRSAMRANTRPQPVSAAIGPVLRVLLNPVFTAISILSSILGIASFYLDHLRKLWP